MPNEKDYRNDTYYEVEAELLDDETNLQNLKKADSFYTTLRQKITQWLAEKGGKEGGKAAEYIMFVPDFFILLVRLVRDKRIASQDKTPLFLAIAYYLSPIDFIPEIFFGPLGYMDDMVLAVIVVNRILSQSREIILEHWEGEEDLILTVQKIIASAENLVGKTTWKKLQKYFSKKVDKR